MTASERTDAELLAAWKAGDDESGNLLVRRHFEAIYCFFSTKVQDAADLTQRTFLAALEGAERFRGDAAFRTWLFAIAKRTLFNHYRGQRRRRERFADLTRLSAIDLDPSPSAVFADREEQGLLLRALRGLPLEMQITLELHYWEAMKLNDIAVVLELPPGTVKSRLSRARKLLRESVASLTDDEHLLRSTLGNLDAWAQAVRRDYGSSADSDSTP